MEEQDAYNRLLVTLESWPDMTFAAFIVYRRLWEAMAGEPGSIDVTIMLDAAKFHLTQQALRRALARLENFGLVKRELTFEDEDGVKKVRVAVFDALQVQADRRRSAVPTPAKQPAEVAQSAPRAECAPPADPTPAADPSVESAPPTEGAPRVDCAPRAARPLSGGATQERHESCATPNALERPTESEASRPIKNPPGDNQEQEIKKLSSSSISNSRTKSNQAQESKPSAARYGPPPLPIARDGDDWADFGDAKPLAAAIEKFAEQLEDPAKVEQQRERRIQALATKILRSVRTAEDLCKTRPGDVMDRSVADKAAAWWFELEADPARDDHDRRAIATQFEKILRRIDQLGREQTLKKPGAYLNKSIGQLVAKAGGVWAESQPEF